MFLDELHIVALPKYKNRSKAQFYQISQAFRFESQILGLITVPAGLLTDFATIPGLVRWVIDDEDPDILYPSIIHDFLYSLTGAVAFPKLSRHVADDVMIEAMRAVNAPKWKQGVVSAGIRAGGARAWARSR